MLTMTEEAWNEFLAEAQAAIDRQNARCIGSYAEYSHELKIEDRGEIILTTAIQHTTSTYGREFDHRDTHYLGWRKADGAPLKITVKVRRTRKAMHRTFYSRPITAQTWVKAATKGPKELLKVSRLVAFIMIGEAYVTGIRHETVGGRPDPEAA